MMKEKKEWYEFRVEGARECFRRWNSVGNCQSGKAVTIYRAFCPILTERFLVSLL